MFGTTSEINKMEANFIGILFDSFHKLVSLSACSITQVLKSQTSCNIYTKNDVINSKHYVSKIPLFQTSLHRKVDVDVKYYIFFLKETMKYELLVPLFLIFFPISSSF